tara:strand:- start:835 stop:1395 length:561 start_codon:yes stop_codon:yes gene_type:complete
LPTYAGIDYSLTSPAICIGDQKSIDFSSVTCYFLSNLARFENFKESNINGNIHEAFRSEQERYDIISSWALDILEDHEVDYVCIEGYSYGSTGRVFNIAENMGILKDRIWEFNLEFEVAAPSAVKKFATGKGNANKEKMYDQFCEENPKTDLKGFLTPRASKVINPVSDIVDSYYILQYIIDKKEE